MTPRLSQGDIIVREIGDMLYRVDEAAPPYPVTVTPLGSLHASETQFEAEDMAEFFVGTPQSTLDKFLQTTGFAHDDDRCNAGSIVTTREVVKAGRELGSEVLYKTIDDLITGTSPKTAADVILVLATAYGRRDELAVRWFDNVGYNHSANQPKCKQCGYLINDAF